MNQPISNNQSDLSVRYAADSEQQINLRELLDIVLSGRWIIFGVTVLSMLTAAFYAFIARPVYQANGLIQVEQQGSGIGGQANELNSLLKGGVSAEAPAELAIIKSRMVLSQVLDSLNLQISAEPKYFPLVGRAIAARKTKLLQPASAPLGFDSYAWGGERIRVTGFEVPADWEDTAFTLKATKGSGYELWQRDQRMLAGRVGERASTKVADGVVSVFVQELHARAGTRFNLMHRSVQSVVADLNGRVTVTEQPRDSGMLSLQVEDLSPTGAVQLINEIEDAYLKQNVERRSAQAQQSLEFLKKQLPDLKANVDKAQAQLNNYQLKKGTVDVKQETELYLKQAIDLETQKQKAIQERAVASQRYTNDHPVVTALNEQIRGIERQQGGLKQQIDTLPETQQEVLSLLRDVDVNTALYTALMNSAQELQVAKAGTVGDVRIIDKGLRPLAPIKPKKKMIVMVGLIAGLMLGVLTVFAMRALLRGVDKPEDVERMTGLPTYASIPFTSLQRTITGQVRKKKSGKFVLAALNSEDIAVEALRSLRTSLHFAMLEASNNIVMFTGPTAALGKSFVSVNMGAVLAQAGKRVVVVDADMRRGLLYRYFNTQQSPGLSDYIANGATLQSVVRGTEVAGLDFIPSGLRPPNPAEILMNERFSDLLKQLSATYDLVLVDTPPVLPVTDAAIVGRQAGTTLIVLKSAEHPMRAIEETVKRLRNAGVTVRGMIFNQVGAKVGSYGYGSYGYSYGYTSYGYGKSKDND